MTWPRLFFSNAPEITPRTVCASRPNRPRHDDATHGADAFLTFDCSNYTPPSILPSRKRVIYGSAMDRLNWRASRSVGRTALQPEAFNQIRSIGIDSRESSVEMITTPATSSGWLFQRWANK
jgi:hypothetical protein